MNRMLAFVITLLLANAAHGVVYKWKDSAGVIHYSDQRHPGAEEVTKVPIQTYKPSTAPARENTETKETATTARYATLTFVSPTNDTTIRDNEGNVAIQLGIEPPLAAGHAIALSIDGVRQEKTVSATTFTLSNMARGTHTLLATVIDDQGNELKSTEALTLHMVRQSVLLRPQDANQPNQGPVQQAPQAPRFRPDPAKSKF